MRPLLDQVPLQNVCARSSRCHSVCITDCVRNVIPQEFLVPEVH